MLSRFAELQEPRSHEANLKSYKFQLLTRLTRTGPRIAVDPTKSHALIEQTEERRFLCFYHGLGRVLI